ncbi:MAG: riboflavin biosynthesis protein RibF [Acidobacteria bacterium]|nr:riboflavin biosynthesis protein RibF [Acidobacteriota bacterium]
MKVVYRPEDLAPELPAPVITIGNFDGVHLGHQNLIKDLVSRAAAVGGTPIVFSFYPHPLQVLAPNNAPLQIQTLRQKLDTFESLGIPLVVLIPFDVQLAQISARDFVEKILWEKLRPKEIYVGPNFAFGHRRQGSFNLLKEIGEEKGFLAGKIHQVQFRGNRVSSTAVRQALISGQVGLARRLLARPFALYGTVVHGTGVGTRFNFPTANLETPNELIPRRGVYITLLSLNGRRYRSVTNIGFRPTVSKKLNGDPGIETHILDFSGDIYGREVSIEFLVRMRDEHRFSGEPALIRQIGRDIQRAGRYFFWMDRAAGSGKWTEAGGAHGRENALWQYHGTKL